MKYDWCLRKGSFKLADYGMKLISMILNQMKSIDKLSEGGIFDETPC